MPAEPSRRASSSSPPTSTRRSSARRPPRPSWPRRSTSTARPAARRPPTSAGNLTPEQRDALRKEIEDKRGSHQKLLQDIVDRDKQIDDLKAQIGELRKKLPDAQSFVVREGGRHDRIAMDYLIKRGISAEKAYNIVSQVGLYDGLLPGFRVWVMFNASERPVRDLGLGRDPPR